MSSNTTFSGRVLQTVSKPTVAATDTAALLARLEALEAQNAALRAKAEAKAKPAEITIMIGKAGKGNVVVYGLGRYPTSLYAGQWLRLLDKATDIRAFIEAHRSELAWKE